MVSVRSGVVEFKFYRPQAGQVHLAGDFNGWRLGELPMQQTEDGHWLARLRLPAGDFRFRYCADGQWYTDYAAFGLEPGRFGLDSVVRVEPQALTFQQSTSEHADIAAA